eukprot:g34154.t1
MNIEEGVHILKLLISMLSPEGCKARPGKDGSFLPYFESGDGSLLEVAEEADIDPLDAEADRVESEDQEDPIVAMRKGEGR